MLHIGKKHRTEVVVNKWPGFFGHRVLRSHKNPGAPAPPFHYEIGPQNTRSFGDKSLLSTPESNRAPTRDRRVFYRYTSEDSYIASKNRHRITNYVLRKFAGPTRVEI